MDAVVTDRVGLFPAIAVAADSNTEISLWMSAPKVVSIAAAASLLINPDDSMDVIVSWSDSF